MLRPTDLLRWTFAIVPAVGIAELGLHFWQTRSHLADDDWTVAKAEVEKRAQPKDLVLFAPAWMDPIGRSKLGGSIATFEREAYPDLTRFPRAIVVSAYGSKAPELEGWRLVETFHAGTLDVLTLENPAPVVLLDDLLEHMGQPDMHVYRTDGRIERECSLERGRNQAPGLGGGPFTPGTRYSCANGGFVGITVLPDLEYHPHRCFYAPPKGPGAILRVRFDAISFGRVLHGHHAISVHEERDRKGSDVTLTFSSGDTHLGQLVHRDGDGWKPFELDTHELAGKKAPLTVDIASQNPQDRQYCFEADTR